MKKFISVLLSAVMLITALLSLPIVSIAAVSGNCGTNAKYTYDLNAGTLVISGTGAMQDYSIDNLPPWNNADCTSNIKTITISSGITEIGEWSFKGLAQVSAISIADTVKKIGARAFDNCAVGAVKITVDIPASVEVIGSLAFKGMSKVTAFNVDEDNEFYSSVDGVIYDKNKTTLIQSPCRLELEELTIPITVTKIMPDAFYKLYNVKDIIVPSGLRTVGDNTTTVFGEIKTQLKLHYPDDSAFDWNIYLKNINEQNITAICFKPETCLDDISCYENVVVENKCTQQGYTLHTCRECGFQYVDSYTEPTGHQFVTNITKATLSENGIEATVCSLCGFENSSNEISRPAKFILSSTSYTYNGKVRRPSVTVKDANGKTINSSNYTVLYASGRKNVGKYKVTIKFKGNYSGTKPLYFTIKPKSTSISSLSALSKGFTVKWKTQSTQTTGYQIQYSTSSKFSSSVTKTISSNKTNTKKITGLKSKKKYYVRVRTYKTVNGTKYYSSWSKTKTIITNK